MPELPEVETTRRGIAPWVEAQRVTRLEVRQPMLRWPVPAQLAQWIEGDRVGRVERRGKYLLFRFTRGWVIIHLGMSGSLRLLPQGTEPGKHDHLDLLFASGQLLRLTDPRRFGAVLWQENGTQHSLLAQLGPEPLSEAFNPEYLQAACKGRRTAIKTLVMNARVVVGIGNIYANEALYRAGIDPRRAAGRIAAGRLALLVEAIKSVLAAAIEQGGTTLRDFVGGDGKPGYFKQQLDVYGRGGQPCQGCGEPLSEIRVGQRSTVYCPRCQR
jgi:formamidopyrimidine-DNA glycosylase